MDYAMTDIHLDPPGEADSHYVERFASAAGQLLVLQAAALGVRKSIRFLLRSGNRTRYIWITSTTSPKPTKRSSWKAWEGILNPDSAIQAGDHG